MNLTPVNSSAIKAIGHDGETLFVEYTSGVYRMEGISAEQYAEVLSAKSVGQAVNALKTHCTACTKVEAEDEQ